MCKIAIIPKIKADKAKLAWKFSFTITPYLTEHDFDGFGYMALGERGLYGERWLDVDAAWKNRNTVDPVQASLLKAYAGALEGQGTAYLPFGEASEKISCIALHARMATCGISLANTHPFVNTEGTVGLIHNGVIGNAREFKRKSTCDSEAILVSYLNNKVIESPQKIQGVANDLMGYYACAVIAQDTQGGWVLDIFKDAQANLEAVFVPALDTIVFCTAAEIVRAACKELGWKMGPIFTVQDSVLIRHNAETGEVVKTLKFTLPIPKRPGRILKFSRDDDPVDTTGTDWNRFEELSNDDAPEDDEVDELDPFFYHRGT